MEGDDQVCELEGADARVLEWETGLPSVDDLTPLSQTLIPPDLASAFSITPEPHKSMLDVNFASQSTISTLRRREFSLALCNYLNSLPSFGEDRFNMESEDNYNETEIRRDGNDNGKGKRLSERDAEEGDSVFRLENDNSNDDQSARALKRPRLVWTPQLHKRFVDVVGHLGIKNAVPKTIMQLMNVEGLTRENVASHLQKYRLYLKRMQCLSNEGPSSSDHLFASTPVPQNLTAASLGSGHREESGHMRIPMPYAPPLLPMPGLGVAHSHGHIAIPINNNHPDVYHGSESHRYSTFGRPVPHRPREQQRDWSGNKLN